MIFLILFFKELMDAEAAYKEMIVPREEEVASYYDLRKQLNIFAEDFRSFITRPVYVVPFLQPGRLVYVRIR
jgi:ATP-dependent RNA helicase DOB1